MDYIEIFPSSSSNPLLLPLLKFNLGLGFFIFPFFFSGEALRRSRSTPASRSMPSDVVVTLSPVAHRSHIARRPSSQSCRQKPPVHGAVARRSPVLGDAFDGARKRRRTPARGRSGRDQRRSGREIRGERKKKKRKRERES